MVRKSCMQQIFIVSCHLFLTGCLCQFHPTVLHCAACILLWRHQSEQVIRQVQGQTCLVTRQVTGSLPGQIVIMYSTATSDLLCSLLGVDHRRIQWLTPYTDRLQSVYGQTLSASDSNV